MMNKTIRCICLVDPYREKLAPKCVDITGTTVLLKISRINLFHLENPKDLICLFVCLFVCLN